MTLPTPPSRVEVSGFQFNEVKAFYHDVGMDSEEDLLHAVLNAGLEPFLVKRWNKLFRLVFFHVFFRVGKAVCWMMSFRLVLVSTFAGVASDFLEGRKQA